MTWPAAQIMQTLCVHSLVKTTLCNKASFWAVMIGAPGIYQTEYVSIVYVLSDYANHKLDQRSSKSSRQEIPACALGGGQDLH